VDPTPAAIRFTVIPPVWRQPWFIAMVVMFIGAVGAQTARVIRRDRRLQEANTALHSANKELFQANVQIQEAAERKSRFLSSMSHELRTPLTSVKGSVDNRRYRK
jgi:signal transduction histidine kinase